MKIKRFDNLWLMGLILCGAILGGVYVLKISFPNFVIEVAHIESITRIGHYIDNHKWAWYLASIVVSLITYYFIGCATCGKMYLSKTETIIVICTTLILYSIKELLPSIYIVSNMSSLILMPLILKADFKATTIVFVSTNFLQSITLQIRGLSAMVTDYNFATSLILTIDFYILLALLYFYFNYEKQKEN